MRRDLEGWGGEGDGHDFARVTVCKRKSSSIFWDTWNCFNNKRRGRKSCQDMTLRFLLNKIKTTNLEVGSPGITADLQSERNSSWGRQTLLLGIPAALFTLPKVSQTPHVRAGNPMWNVEQACKFTLVLVSHCLLRRSKKEEDKSALDQVSLYS